MTLRIVVTNVWDSLIIDSINEMIELANGKNLEDIADETSSEADTEGITVFMYGAAVSILSKCWVQGETLRRWHNSKYQIGNEGDKANESGGVLNPAMLTIG